LPFGNYKNAMVQLPCPVNWTFTVNS
jgi:hypothetical protein